MARADCSERSVANKMLPSSTRSFMVRPGTSTGLSDTPLKSLNLFRSRSLPSHFECASYQVLCLSIRSRLRQPPPSSFPQKEVPVDPSKGIDKSQKRELCKNKVNAEVSHRIGVFEF